ncbi:hypothetical protein C8J56DRAFT_337605 [Mycena floridula]|nr:hypothetical protein C8J56DRAFT_337605 [Mycena floridula]
MCSGLTSRPLYCYKMLDRSAASTFPDMIQSLRSSSFHGPGLLVSHGAAQKPHYRKSMIHEITPDRIHRLLDRDHISFPSLRHGMFVAVTAIPNRKSAPVSSPINKTIWPMINHNDPMSEALSRIGDVTTSNGSNYHGTLIVLDPHPAEDDLSNPFERAGRDEPSKRAALFMSRRLSRSTRRTSTLNRMSCLDPITGDPDSFLDLN